MEKTDSMQNNLCVTSFTAAEVVAAGDDVLRRCGGACLSLVLLPRTRTPDRSR